MKTIKILLLLAISILAFGCSKDDDNDEKMDLTTSLKQTSWKGIYQVGDISEATVGLAFYTEKGGYCDRKNNDDGLVFQDFFEYTADGKLLVIKGSAVSGNWLLASKNKKTMVLEKGTGGDPSTQVRMILEREN